MGFFEGVGQLVSVGEKSRIDPPAVDTTADRGEKKLGWQTQLE